MANKPLLDVRDLSVSFRMYDSALGQHDMQVIHNLCVSVSRGEILAIAGSSGSGKSLLAHAVMGLLPENAGVSGTMRYDGYLLDHPLQARLRGRKIALIPQSVEYLDPLMRVGKQVQGVCHSYEQQRRVFERFGLCEKSERMYPFQLSGGMARRVLISTAVIGDADLIIADEPTPGLDTEMAVRALQDFRTLADSGKAVVLITHDIDLAFQIADRIAVFYAGTIVEIANAADFRTGADALRHPYSKALYHALPQNGFHPIEGVQPYAKNLPRGCLFAPRCPHVTPACEQKIPMRPLREGMVRCIHAT